MFLDLTQPFTNSMPAFPGDPAPELTQIASFEKDSCVGYELRTGLHVGTHIDAPLHFIPGGKRISDFPPEKFMGRGVVIDSRAGVGTSSDLSLPPDLVRGDIVLIATGWSKKFHDSDYYENHPVISEAFAEQLIDRGVKILGLDTPSPDTAPYNIHKLLLSHDILIIENLTNLETLLGYKNFEIIALPLKLEAEASPVRVIAKISTLPVDTPGKLGYSILKAMFSNPSNNSNTTTTTTNT